VPAGFPVWAVCWAGSLVVGRPSRVEAILVLGRVGRVARAALVGHAGGITFSFSSRISKAFLFQF
jgi:hypothetical protein